MRKELENKEIGDKVTLTHFGGIKITYLVADKPPHGPPVLKAIKIHD